MCIPRRKYQFPVLISIIVYSITVYSFYHGSKKVAETPYKTNAIAEQGRHTYTKCTYRMWHVDNSNRALDYNSVGAYSFVLVDVYYDGILLQPTKLPLHYVGCM